MKGRAVLTILAVFLLFLCLSPVYAGDETASSKPAAAVTAEQEGFMRQAFDLAIASGKRGNHTFGALLVYQGKVILTTENTVNTTNDFTRHAEVNLLVEARRKFPPAVLKEATVYASAAPCTACCAVALYSGVRKIVYGVSYEALEKTTGYKEKGIACDKLYSGGGTPLEWTGPVLEKEGLKVFCCWPEDSFRPTLVRNLGGCGDMRARCKE